LKAVAQRRDTVVGVNQYANVKEKPLAPRDNRDAEFYQQRVKQIAAYRSGAEETLSTIILERLNAIVNGGPEGLVEAVIAAAQGGATLGEITRALRGGEQPECGVAPVKMTRAAAALEKIRAAVDAHVAKHGRPKVFLANLGPVKQHKARADFCRGFFAVGGFESVYPAGFPSPEAAAQKAVESGAPVIVICSTDETYPELVPPLAKAIKAADPKRIVILAGYPAEQIEAHKQAGVDDFVHVRVNAAEFITNILTKIGVNL
jgi:methylmalonyl-CoA mutase